MLRLRPRWPTFSTEPNSYKKPLAVIKRLCRANGLNTIKHKKPSLNALDGQQNAAFEKVERRVATAAYLGPDIVAGRTKSPNRAFNTLGRQLATPPNVVSADASESPPPKGP